MDNKYLTLPFARYDTPYLESLPDKVFFACRFTMSDEDTALILNNSKVIDGRRFYKAKVRNPILEKYAAMTNPKEGEPGSKSNPLIRFGKKYVYNTRGKLVIYIENQTVAATLIDNRVRDKNMMISRNAIKVGIRGRRHAGKKLQTSQIGRRHGNHFGWAPVSRGSSVIDYRNKLDETFVASIQEKCKVPVKV